MVEKTEGAIKNGQSRDTGIIGHKIIEQRQTIQKKNAIQKFKVSTIFLFGMDEIVLANILFNTVPLLYEKVASLERDNLVIFCHLSAYIWSDKRSGF
jgi:hypothetical protein